MVFSLMGLLGMVAACDDDGGFGEPVAEYGVPFARYIIKGTVKSSDELKVIRDIQLTNETDTIYTDINGGFTLVYTVPAGTPVAIIHCADVDGLSNGKYKPKDAETDLSAIPLHGAGGHFFAGEGEKQIVITLDPDKL